MPSPERLIAARIAQTRRGKETRGMWHELLIGLALMLVIEGVAPFLSPSLMRQALSTMAQMDDRSLRLSGLLSMVIGVILLYLLR